MNDEECFHFSRYEVVLQTAYYLCVGFLIKYTQRDVRSIFRLYGYSYVVGLVVGLAFS